MADESKSMSFMKKIAFALAFALAFVAFVSCSSIEYDPSSSSGNNGDSSSSIGGGDGNSSSSSGSDISSSSGGNNGDSSSSIDGGDGDSSSSDGNDISSSSGGNNGDSSSSIGGGDGNSSSSSSSDISSSSSGNSSSSSIGGNSSSSSVGGNPSSSTGSSPNLWTGFPFDNLNENLSASPNCPYLDQAIEITYNNGSAPQINNPYGSEVSISSGSGENVVVTLSGGTERNLRVSGTAQNGSLKVYGGNSQVILYLNGVNIKNNSGPALNFQKGKKVTVCLVSGKENYLDGASAAPQGDEQAKGAFFSEEKLYFTGSGSLEVKSRQGQGNGHAIVVDNDFEIDNGKIIISEAYGDGIHANDNIEIKGGVIKIASKGDAIQSEKPGSSVEVSGGKILAKTTGVKSHGITSEGTITIKDAAKVQISVLGNGSKGIKSTSWTEIKGGTIKVLALGGQDQSDNDITDISTAAGIKVGNTDVNIADLSIEGGELTIRSDGSKAKGINTSGDIRMTNGIVDVNADDDGIKVHGILKISGGVITAKSSKKKAIDGTIDEKGGTINVR
jgi:hypothetical protein